ncbi:hypothetical protein HC174_08380 [Salinimicrobium sp. CDJ15-81-2]|nr:hypothetical protein [Salinimicrobium nanhaiense]
MIVLISNTALGFGIVVSTVLLAVIVYTIIKLRKQVKEAEKKKKDP